MKKTIVYLVAIGMAFSGLQASAQKAPATPKSAPSKATPAKKDGNLTKPAAEKSVVVTDPILLNVAGEAVSRSEFERVFKKNNRDSVFTETSVREYLELYINYKLKVKEAESLKMDTSETFRSELTGYRKQLAQPYLNDKEVS